MEQNKAADQAAPNPKAAVLEKPEVKEAIAKFKQTSGLELKKLCTEGLDFQEAVNKLVDKLRSSRIQFQCTDQNLKLVSKVSGFDRRGAIRVLLIREELVRLRQLGYSTSDAIYELINRIRRLAGQKRGISELGINEEERIAKRPKLKNERSKKRTFDQAGYGEDSQELALGEEEIEHKKKKRKVGFELDESSISEVSRSDAVREDEPSTTTDQDDSSAPRRSSSANLFSRLFSLFAAGNNNSEGLTGNPENHTDGTVHPSLLLPHTPPGYEQFDEDEEDQLDDEELYEFQDDNSGEYENANVGGEFSDVELPQLNNNSDSVDGDDDVNDENGPLSRKRSRDLNSNESESEPKRKRTNNSTNSTGLFLQRQNSCK